MKSKTHLYSIFVILLLFGGRKLPELMKGMGKGIKGFKDEMSGDGEKENDKKIEEFDSYGEWLESHGLQLSLAFGGEEKGKNTRFRIDYRWHDRADDQLFMQLEIPFQ